VANDLTPTRPVIYDAGGRPIRLDREGPIPHVYTFEGLLSGSWQTYWMGRHDEAMRHSRENALAMFLDEHIQSCLWERVRSSTKLKWRLEVDSPNDPWQKAVADGLTKLIKMTPRLRQYKRWLLWQALWAGRAGNQQKLGWDEIDVEGLGRHRGLRVAGWKPINGDKIAYRWDDTPAILVNTGVTADMPNASTLLTTEARAVELRGPWRERVIIHKVNVCDVDFRESDRADAIHGLGIRHWLFWSWWNKQEFISAVIKSLDKVGLGLVIIEYDQGNPKAEDEAKKAAKNLSVDRSVMTVPVPKDRLGNEAVRVVNTPVAGAQVMLQLQDACERREERFIIAQTGSSRSDSSGMGTHDPSFMMETKSDLVEEDAGELDETLTGHEGEPGLVGLLKKYTYPWADFPVRHVADVKPPDPERRLGAATMAYNLGAALCADEVREVTGFSKPGPDDEVLQNPALAQAAMQAQQGAMVGPDGQPIDPAMMEQGGAGGAGQPSPGGPLGGDGELDTTDPIFAQLMGEAGGADVGYWTRQRGPRGGKVWVNPATGERSRRDHGPAAYARDGAAVADPPAPGASTAPPAPTAATSPLPVATPDHAAAYKTHGVRAPRFKAWFGDWEHQGKVAHARHPDAPADHPKGIAGRLRHWLAKGWEALHSAVVGHPHGEPQTVHPVEHSKVMKDGLPTTVYHGTSNANFDAFDPAKTKDPEGLLYGPGFYFTEDPEVARTYTEKDKQHGPLKAEYRGLPLEELLRRGNEAIDRWAKRFAPPEPTDPNDWGQNQKAEDWKEEVQAASDTFDRLARRGQLADQGGHVYSVGEGPWEDWFEPRPGGVHNAYLNVRRPFDIDREVGIDEFRRLNEAAGGALTQNLSEHDRSRLAQRGPEFTMPAEEVYQLLKDAEYFPDRKPGSKAAANRLLQKAGYDGLTHIGGFRWGAGERPHRVWVAFEPNQIKHKDNVGTFDPGDPRMHYARDDSPARYAGRGAQAPILYADPRPPRPGQAPKSPQPLMPDPLRRKGASAVPPSTPGSIDPAGVLRPALEKPTTPEKSQAKGARPPQLQAGPAAPQGAVQAPAPAQPERAAAPVAAGRLQEHLEGGEAAPDYHHLFRGGFDWSRATPADHAAAVEHLKRLPGDKFWGGAVHAASKALSGKNPHAEEIRETLHQAMKAKWPPRRLADLAKLAPEDQGKAAQSVRVVDTSELEPDQAAEVASLLRGLPQVRGIPNGYALPAGMKLSAVLGKELPAKIRNASEEELAAALRPPQPGEEMNPAQRPSFVPAEAWDHMTPAERQDVVRSRVQTVQDAARFFESLPPEEEFQAAMKAGAAKRGWYQRFANVVGVWGKDKDLFAKVLAANSTKNSVRRNLVEALGIWRAWKAAGRPTETVEVTEKSGHKSVTMPFLQELAKEPGLAGVNFPARRVATVKLLSGWKEGREIESPKTGSFSRNLRGNDPENRQPVTNDAWMAMLGSTARDAEEIQQLFGSLPHYHAFSAKVRKAAGGIGHDPREGQETAWSSFMAMAGLAAAGLSPPEIVRYLSHEHVRGAGQDYLDLMLGDEDARRELRRLRLLKRVEQAARAGQEGTGRQGEAGAGPVFRPDDPHALRLAERAVRYASSFRGKLTPFQDAVAAAKAERAQGQDARQGSPSQHGRADLAELYAAFDAAQHPRDEDGQFTEQLNAIPHGDRRHVGGWLVRRDGPEDFRVETDTGHLRGNVQAVLAHLRQDLMRRGLEGRRLTEAMKRAGEALEPDPLADPAGAERHGEAFDALPKGARVVSLDPNTRGRVGTVVKEKVQGQDGKTYRVNRVKLDGDPGFASSHVEPLDPQHSWRAAVQPPPAPPGAPAGGLFGDEPAPGKRARKPELKPSELLKVPEPAPRPTETSDPGDFFAPKEGGQGRLFSRSHLPALAGEPVAYGRWITIGAREGEDGEKHGGSRVYIDGGRITKGHPSLTGRKVGAMGEGGDLSHREAQHAEKGHARAAWAKRAKAEGIDPSHLHSLAGEILAHDKAHKADHTKALQRARQLSERLGYGSLLALHHKVARGADADSVKGLDDVAERLSEEHPHVFAGHESDREGRLFDLLAAGNPEAMGEDEAYEQAFDHLVEARGRGAATARGEGEEEIPFRRDPERYAGTLAERVETAAADVHAGPTLAQRDAGNHKMGHVVINGLPVTIEVARGQQRRGVGRDGKEWSKEMHAHYGRIKRSEGADGEHFDVYVGSDPDSEIVFVIDQLRADGSFDEHKAVLGVNSARAARELYLKHIPADRLGDLTPMTLGEFKAWLAEGNTKRPLKGQRRTPRRYAEADEPLLYRAQLDGALAGGNVSDIMLRHLLDFLQERGWTTPGARELAESLRQLLSARPDLRRLVPLRDLQRLETFDRRPGAVQSDEEPPADPDPPEAER
jgi:hypothetical protein